MKNLVHNQKEFQEIENSILDKKEWLDKNIEDIQFNFCETFEIMEQGDDQYIKPSDNFSFEEYKNDSFELKLSNVINNYFDLYKSNNDTYGNYYIDDDGIENWTSSDLFLVKNKETEDIFSLSIKTDNKTFDELEGNLPGSTEFKYLNEKKKQLPENSKKINYSELPYEIKNQFLKEYKNSINKKKNFALKILDSYKSDIKKNDFEKDLESVKDHNLYVIDKTIDSISMEDGFKIELAQKFHKKNKYLGKTSNILSGGINGPLNEALNNKYGIKLNKEELTGVQNRIVGQKNIHKKKIPIEKLIALKENLIEIISERNSINNTK